MTKSNKNKKLASGFKPLDDNQFILLIIIKLFKQQKNQQTEREEQKMKPLYAILVNNVLFALAYTDKEVDEKCEKHLSVICPMIFS